MAFFCFSSFSTFNLFPSESLIILLLFKFSNIFYNLSDLFGLLYTQSYIMHFELSVIKLFFSFLIWSKFFAVGYPREELLSSLFCRELFKLKLLLSIYNRCIYFGPIMLYWSLILKLMLSSILASFLSTSFWILSNFYIRFWFITLRAKLSSFYFLTNVCYYECQNTY